MRPRTAVLTGVAASSASVLMLEIVLTRVFAVTQFYHFAFLTVSLALLGFGASGSALSAIPALGRGGPRRWSLLATLQGLAAVAAYLVANRLPLDTFAIAWDRWQILYLVIYYLALAVPFFLGGTVIGVLLSGRGQDEPIPSHRVYAASLGGSAVGCLAALGGIPTLGGEHTVAAAGSVAALGAICFALVDRPLRRRGLLFPGAAVILLALLTLLPTHLLDLQMSPYKGLSSALRYPNAEVVSTDWDLAARVDHVSSEGIRSLPGLSLSFAGIPPPQDAVAFDGDDLSPVTRASPRDAPFASQLLSALPYVLRPGSDVLVLDPRGGLSVLTALANGAASVTAVEPHRAALAAARTVTDNPYDHPSVRVAVSESRPFVESTGATFDVVEVALTSSYRPVFSGAYSLAEDYRLTVEAFDAYLERLRFGGILAASAWVQTPPSEETRLVAIAAEAIRRDRGDPAPSVVVLRSYSLALVLAAPDGFTPADLDEIRRFAESRRFDLVAAPGLTAADANRFNVLPQDEYHRLATALLTTEQPAAAYREAGFDIRPPTDDHPFFGHFFTWDQAGEVLDAIGTTWQPFGGAGYFVLVALLVLSAIGATALILAPLLVARIGRRRPDKAPRTWTFGYFGLLGLGFLLVEIPLIQQYILLVGSPTSAVAVVLFALLLSSGAGSLASRRVPWRRGAVVLTLAIIAYPFLVRWVTSTLLAAPGELRMAAGAVLIAPLGFLMGTMFPNGLARLEREAPHLVPWAWGINGTMSVISAACAALLALTSGFRLVVFAGALCYAACIPLTQRPLKNPPG